MTKTITILAILALASCDLLHPTTPEERGIKVNRDITIEHQPEALLFAEELVETYYDIDLGGLSESAKVWWADTTCPYHPDQYAILMKYRGSPDRCFKGITFTCNELYVALSQRDPKKVCGSALVHEFGHCIYLDIWNEGDRYHLDSEFWDLISGSSDEACARDW